MHQKFNRIIILLLYYTAAFNNIYLKFADYILHTILNLTSPSVWKEQCICETLIHQQQAVLWNINSPTASSGVFIRKKSQCPNLTFIKLRPNGASDLKEVWITVRWILLVIRFMADLLRKYGGVSCDHGGARRRRAPLCSQLTPYIFVVGRP